MSYDDESYRVCFVATIVLPFFLWHTFALWVYIVYLIARFIEYKYNWPVSGVFSVLLWVFVVHTERWIGIAACTSLCTHHLFFKLRVNSIYGGTKKR